MQIGDLDGHVHRKSNPRNDWVQRNEQNKEERSQQEKSSTIDPVTSVDNGDTQQRTVSQQQQCTTTLDSHGTVVPRKKG